MDWPTFERSFRAYDAERAPERSRFFYNQLLLMVKNSAQRPRPRLGRTNERGFTRPAGPRPVDADPLILLLAPVGQAASLDLWASAAGAQRWRGRATSPTQDAWEVAVSEAAAAAVPDAPSGMRVWRAAPIGARQGPAPQGAGGLLINMMSVPPEHVAEFHAWYETEHFPRLSAVPGLLAARRFRAIEGRPEYLAVYHLADPELVLGEAWKTAAQTPWTERVRTLQSENLRLVCRPATDLPGGGA